MARLYLSTTVGIAWASALGSVSAEDDESSEHYCKARSAFIALGKEGNGLLSLNHAAGG